MFAKLKQEKRPVHILDNTIHEFNGVVKYTKIKEIPYEKITRDGKSSNMKLITTTLLLRPLGNDGLKKSEFYTVKENEPFFKIPVYLKMEKAPLKFENEYKEISAKGDIFFNLEKDQTKFKPGDFVTMKGLYYEKTFETEEKKRKRLEKDGDNKKIKNDEGMIKKGGEPSVDPSEKRAFYNLKPCTIENATFALLSAENRQKRPKELKIETITDETSKYLDVALSEIYDSSHEKKYVSIKNQKQGNLIYYFVPSENRICIPAPLKSEGSADVVSFDSIQTIGSLIRFGGKDISNEKYPAMVLEKIYYEKNTSKVGTDKTDQDGKAMMAFAIHFEEKNEDVNSKIRFFRHSVYCAAFDTPLASPIKRMYGIYNLYDLLRVMRINQPNLIIFGSALKVEEENQITMSKKSASEYAKETFFSGTKQQQISGIQYKYPLEICNISCCLEKYLQEEGLYFKYSHLKRILYLLCDQKLLSTEVVAKNPKLFINNLNNDEFTSELSVLKEINNMNTSDSSVINQKELGEYKEWDQVSQGRVLIGYGGSEKDHNWKNANFQDVLETEVVDGKSILGILKDNYKFSNGEEIDKNRVQYQNLFLIYQIVICNIKSNLSIPGRKEGSALMKPYRELMINIDKDLVKEFGIEDHEYPDQDKFAGLEKCLCDFTVVPFTISIDIDAKENEESGGTIEASQVPEDMHQPVSEDHNNPMLNEMLDDAIDTNMEGPSGNTSELEQDENQEEEE